MAKILVAGSLNMDICLSVKHFPREGETVIGKSMMYNPGGKGANQAAAAAKLGAQVAMLGVAGRDGFGDAVLKALISCGADVSAVKRAEIPTGTALICVDDAGRNNIVAVPGANSLCGVEYLKSCEGALESCDVLMLQMEIPHEAVWYLAKRGKSLGKTVMLNPAPAPEIIPQDVLEGLSWLTPNERELETLTGLPAQSEEEIGLGAEKLLSMGVQNLLVTMGGRGVFMANAKSMELIPAEQVEAVDSTAAGDCFSGAFATALSEGKSPRAAAAFACRAAAISVTRPGAQISLPSRAEVEAFQVRACGHGDAQPAPRV